MSLVTLKRRGEFLRIRGGARWSTGNFVLEAKLRSSQDGKLTTETSDEPRFGFTVTKKLGNAVVRNRIRRRLREAVRVHGLQHALNGCDYVVIARESALRSPFEGLRQEFILALEKVNRKLGDRRTRDARHDSD